jgi:cyclopropane fatty-acyl-phospholipid synthase-like methyltransferase
MAEQIGFSQSEDSGIELLPVEAKKIYSVGISTGGVAEIRMAHERPNAHIIATTIDEKGVVFAQERIAEAGLTSQVETKLEDVSKPLEYADGYFDYVYARLVLHYLPKNRLHDALKELYRVLRIGGKMFVVVRSVNCPDATREGAEYNEETGLTTCTVHDGDHTYRYARYFHSEQTITNAVKTAGFTVQSVKSYDEKLFKDFMRTIPADHTDNIIQVIAER